MPDNSRKELAKIVHTHMSEADEDTVRIVVAIAGLLACVAFADRKYTVSEQDQVQRELTRIRGISNAGVEAICEILKDKIFWLTVTAAQNYERDLYELTEPETRLEVLDALMALAAADGTVSVVETNFLRRTANGLGLSSEDYNAAQARYRDKLSVLKG
jgi:uncharacterized tellurite resistance protein B-like protein